MDSLGEARKLIEEKLNKMVFTRTTCDDWAVGFRAGMHHALRAIEIVEKETKEKESKEQDGI